MAVLALAAALSGCLSATSVAQAAPLSNTFYIHDTDGRVLAVVEPASDAYVYHYDAVGNVVAVSHQPAKLSLLRISPLQVGPGQVAHLFGTGFANTAARDLVTIGGARTAPKVVSPVQLDVTVPLGFRGGIVKVTVGRSTARGPAPLVIASTPPRIASVVASSPLQTGSLIVPPGDQLTINGTGFDVDPSEDRVTIGQVFASVMSATTRELRVELPPDASFSGRMVVTTPAGSIRGPYVFTVPSAATNNSYKTLSNIASGHTTFVSLRSGVSELLTIDGHTGQRVSIRVGHGSVSSGSVEILSPGGYPVLVGPEPGGEALTSVPFTTAADLLLTASLPRNGTYLIAVSSAGPGGVVPVTVSLLTDQTETISLNGPPVTAKVSTPGRRVLLPFNVAAGTGVTVQYRADTFLGGSGGFSTDFIYLADRTGNPFGPVGRYSTALGSSRSGYFSTAEALAPGRYDLVVDPSETGDTGSVTLRVLSFRDQLGPITPNGPSVAAKIVVPGQRAIFSFEGTAGRRAAVAVSDNRFTSAGCCNDVLQVIDPTGTVISQESLTSPTQWLAPVALTTSGRYQVMIDPSQGDDTGSASLKLYEIADKTGSITPNGPPVTAKVTVRGQRAIYSFHARVGQRVAVLVSANSFTSAGCCNDVLQVLDPTGSEILGDTLTKPTQWLAPATVMTAGTYSVVIDPSQGGDTGSVTVKLLSITDITGSITPNGPPVTAKVTVRGQRAIYSFSATVGQSATVAVSDNSFTSSGCCDDVLSLVDPTGSTVESVGLTNPTAVLGLEKLDATGTFTVELDPSQSGDTGHAKLELTTLPPRSAVKRHTKTARRAPAAARRPRTTRTLSESFGRLSATARTPTMAERRGDVTLSGLVMTNRGYALPGVTLSVGDQTTTSGRLGRFTLHHLRAGRYLLHIDGSTAKPTGVWGYYGEVVDLVAGFDNQLPAVVWMTPVDNAHAVSFTYPIKEPLVVTNPELPGLELRLPAGTVIRDDGKLVHKISITPVSVDTPPYPLPPTVTLPYYFTIQPGGAAIQGDGVQLIYPNWGHQPPGSRMTFWEYDLDWNGWWVYGHGTVSANGTQVVPDKSTHLDDFSGAMFNSGPQPPEDNPGPCGCGRGDLIDLSSGLFDLSRTDMTLPDVMPVTLTRYYRQGDPDSYRFGIGTNDLYGINLWSSSQAAGLGRLNLELVLPDEQEIPYHRTTPGVGWTDAEFVADTRPGEFFGSIVTWNGNGWDLTLNDGTTYVFGEEAPLEAIRDRYGNQITVTYAGGGTGGFISNVTSPNGRWISFTNDGEGRVAQATDNSGRTVSYAYDTFGRLVSVTDVRGKTTKYTYDSNNEMTTIVDPLGHTVLTNSYHSDGTVATQSRPGGGTTTLTYTRGRTGQITATRMTDPRGSIELMTFNAAQEPLTDTVAYGTSLSRTTTNRYNPSTNLLASSTDPLGRTTAYTYDALGNLSSETQMAGTSEARTTSYRYDPAFSRLTSTRDPLGNTTTIRYTDDLAATTEIVTDPTGRTTTIVSRNGQPVSFEDGAGDTSSAEYNGGDLVAVTNPLGLATRQFVDTAGFARSLTSPSGAVWSATYDAAGNITVATDPLGNTTRGVYDAAGNLTAFIDANGHATHYTYDQLYRVTKETDPLGASTTITFDNAGDPVSITDPNGTIDKATYDLLGEPTRIDWGVSGNRSQSVTTDTYDKAGRLLSTSNSRQGTITRTYDNFNNLTRETQPNGTISYTYDKDNRRTTTEIGSAGTMSYTYDMAGRVATVSIGRSTATIGYDAAGRQRSTTYPGGLTETYTYDHTSDITAIRTTGAATQTLAYTYDPDGQLSGLRTNGPAPLAPQTVSRATYNADDELTAWGITRFTYDANGNITSDGANTYTWNPQQELTTVTSAAGTIKIGYDPFGRQSSLATSAGNTNYLHDLARPALTTTPSGSTLYANNPTNGQTLLETNSTGTDSLTTDLLGSTTAVISSSGKTLTTYGYDPFGNTSASDAAASTNDITYGGYEQTVPGLDSTTARYYLPQFQRFASPDPSGLSVGQDPYEYADDDPLDFVDPSGLDPEAGQSSFASEVVGHMADDMVDNRLQNAPDSEWEPEVPKPANEYKDALEPGAGQETQHTSWLYGGRVIDAWRQAINALAGQRNSGCP